MSSAPRQLYTECMPCLEHAIGGLGLALPSCTSCFQVWDLRKEAVTFNLQGHGDSVTGLALNPEGTHLLTNSMDNTLRVWDVRSLLVCSLQTCRTLQQHGSCCAWCQDWGVCRSDHLRLQIDACTCCKDISTHLRGIC